MLIKVKCHGVIRPPIYCLLLVNWPNYMSPLRDIRLRNLSDLDVSLSRSSQGQI